MLTDPKLAGLKEKLKSRQQRSSIDAWMPPEESSFASRLGENLKKAPKEVLADPVIGIAKTGLEGIKGGISLGERFLKGFGRILTPKEFEETFGFAPPEQTAAEKLIPESLTKRTTPGQKAGGFAAELATFAVPLGAASKATKGAGLAKQALAEGLATGATEAVTSGDVDTGTALAGALGTLGVPAEKVIGGVAKAAKKYTGGIGNIFKGLKTENAIKTADSWTDVKAGLAGIDDNFRPILEQVDEDLANEFISTSKAFNQNVKNPTPHDLAVDKMQKGFDELEKVIADEGSLIGQARRKIETTQAAPEQIQNAIENMKPILDDLGYVTDKGGVLKPIKGREPRLSVTELQEAQNIVDSLYRLKGSPNLARVLDNRINIEQNIKFAKQRGDISSNLDKLSQVSSGELRDILANAIGKSEAERVASFAELKTLMSEFRDATSKGKNFDKYIKRLLSERGGANKNLAETFAEITGVDPMELAILNDLSNRLLIKSNKGLPLLMQEVASGSGGKDIFTRSFDAIVGFVRDKTVDPEKQIINVIKNKKTRDQLLKKLEELSKATD